MHGGTLHQRRTWSVTTILALHLLGCFALRSSAGGGQVTNVAGRAINPDDVAVPEGYSVTVVASGLTFPTGVTWDASGVLHVVEAGYSYGEVFATPRLLRV